VADNVIAIQDDAFVLGLVLPESGTATLAWMCPRFHALADSRRLGLPVAAIDIGTAEGAAIINDG
jgi:hypothetical protein